MKAVKDVVRKTWLDGLFDAVLAEFQKLVEESGEDSPRGGPVSKVFEDAVGNVINDSFTYEAFYGSQVADNRAKRSWWKSKKTVGVLELKVFALGVLAGERLDIFGGLNIVSGTWLDGLFDKILTEHEKLLEESQGVGTASSLMKAAVGNIIPESFSLSIFSRHDSPAADRVGAYNTFTLGVLSGQKLVKIGHSLKPVPNPGELQ